MAEMLGKQVRVFVVAEYNPAIEKARSGTLVVKDVLQRFLLGVASL